MSARMRSSSLAKITAFCRYTLQELRRSAFLALMFCNVMGLFLLSDFLSSTLLAESASLQPMLYAAIIRVSNVLLLVMALSSAITTDFDTRLSHMFLSAPVDRSVYYLGRLLGFLLAALFMASLSSLPLMLMTTDTVWLYWGASHFLELSIVGCFALLCSCSLSRSLVAFFATLCFYVLSRLYGSLQSLLDSPFFDTTAGSGQLLNWAVEGIGYVLPTLYQYARSEWFINPSELAFEVTHQAIQTGILGALFCIAGLFDLKRKEL